MIDIRTDVEKNVHEILRILLRVFEKRKISTVEFQMMMGQLRNAEKMLENKRLGCVTGKHLTECLCKHGLTLGVSTFKNRIRKSA